MVTLPIVALASSVIAAEFGGAFGDNGSANDSLFEGLTHASSLSGAIKEFWAIIGPGGKLHPAYFLEHKGHLVVEAVLLFVILYLFLQHTFKPRPKSEEPLTEKVHLTS